MSFRCGICNKLQGSRVKPVHVILETRRVKYPPTKNNKIPEGYEIVREADLCESCASRR